MYQLPLKWLTNLAEKNKILRYQHHTSSVLVIVMHLTNWFAVTSSVSKTELKTVPHNHEPNN